MPIGPNLVKVLSLSSGVGQLTLGQSVSGFRGIEAMQDGATYSYTIQPGDGSYEIGRGVYTMSGSTFARTPLASSSNGSPLSVAVGAPIALALIAEDLSDIVSQIASKADGSAFALLSETVGTLNTDLGNFETTLDTATTDITGLTNNKVDRYPASPASIVRSNYEYRWTEWYTHFFDGTNNRLFPTRGLGPTNAGCVDTTLPDANGNKLSPWQWALGILAMYDRWMISQAAADAALLQGAWTYFQTQFTYAQMVNTTYGQNATSGLSDDNASFAMALWSIYAATGDTNALKVLVEYITVTYIMYQDTRTSNPITTYSATTPGGLTPQHNQLGIKYAYDNSYGDTSYSIEGWLGSVAANISQLPVATVAALYSGAGATASATALQAAYLQLSKDVWTCMHTYFRFAGSGQADAGLYVASVNLASGNVPGSQVHTDIWPTTRRGITAFFDAGTIGMGELSDILYGITNNSSYLAEVSSVATAYSAQTIGFGRNWNGLPCLVNARDPWTDGARHAEFCRRFAERFPSPSANSAFRLAILGAAKVISAQSAAGIVSPNWGPPEIGPMSPADYTWEQSSMAGYSGSGGGGQGSGRQIMTASSSMGVMAAACYFIPTETALGSGMAEGAIDILTGNAAALLAAAQATLLNPMQENGAVRVQWDSIDQHWSVFLFEKEVMRLDPNGLTILGGETDSGVLYWGNSINNFTAYLGNDGTNNPVIAFASGVSITWNVAKTRFEFYIGSSLMAALDASGNIRARGTITPSLGNNV